MEILAMETTTEKCFLKTDVLNFQNIKKIIYNFSNIFSFPCALLVMEFPAFFEKIEGGNLPRRTL